MFKVCGSCKRQEASISLSILLSISLVSLGFLIKFLLGLAVPSALTSVMLPESPDLVASTSW